MGGSSKSSNKTNTNTSTNTLTPQMYESEGSYQIAGIEGSNVNVTDGGSVEMALDVVSQNITANENAHESNTLFLGQAGSAVINAVKDSSKLAAEQTAQAMADMKESQRLAAEQTAHAMAQMSKTQTESYEFAGGAVNASIDGMNKSQLAGYEFAGGATSAAYDFIDDEREFLKTIVNGAVGSVTDAASQASSNVIANSKYAIDKVGSASRSETAGFMNNAVLAMAAVGGLWVLRR